VKLLVGVDLPALGQPLVGLVPDRGLLVGVQPDAVSRRPE
jgi:hypothetical protein